MPAFEEILVPTDGSDGARAALDLGTDLAAHYGATVHVVCVVDEWNLERVPPEDDSRLRRASEIVDEAIGAVDADVPIESSVEIGVVHEVILAYGAEEGIDLVAMGTHGLTGLQRYLLGSVTAKVLRLADRPVLTVRAHADGGPRDPFEDVLVPTDGSERAAAAAEYGVDVAATYGATLHAVSVVDRRTGRFARRSGPVGEELADRARSAVRSVEDDARAAGIERVRTATPDGVPSRAIVEYADDQGVDLIAMGAHGRSGFERVLLGSVAEKVLRTSPVPVMTVRGADED